VAAEKGTKAVISLNFSVYVERTFNNLRANFAGEIPRKEFFNTHRIFQQQSFGNAANSVAFIDLPGSPT
jgi:hypothetical protein